jgi:thiol-disulfide isomerase/thioredoxin
VAAFSQSQYSVSGKLNGCTGKKIFLSKVIGKQIVKIDSFKSSDNCKIHFIFPDSSYKGVFRISEGDDNYADLIFNKENISFESDASGLSDKMNIIKSEENKEYYEYLHKSVSIDDSINLMTDLGQKLYDLNHSKVTSELNKVAKKITVLEQQKRDLSNSLISAYTESFTSKMIKAMLPPDFKAYQKKKRVSDYPNENEFLREHFFDNVDFSDSNMLHTTIIFDKVGQYFQYFASPPTVDLYKRAVDFILIRSAANRNVNDFVINTLLNTFDHSNLEDVYSYIAEKYLASNTCGDDSKLKKLSEKDSIIKGLKPGHKAPSINAQDLNGKIVLLDSIKASYTLIMFWASWCEFCEKAMPEIRNIYGTYKSKGLEIYAVSLDSIKQNWAETSKQYNIQWINTSNLKGYRSPVITDYNIWQTPTYFLLDADKKIVYRPANTSMLKEKLEKINW